MKTVSEEIDEVDAEVKGVILEPTSYESVNSRGLPAKENTRFIVGIWEGA